MKKVNLIGMDTEVEFCENDVFDWLSDNRKTYPAAVTTCGRLICWDDAVNSWVQVWRNAEEALSREQLITFHKNNEGEAE